MVTSFACKCSRLNYEKVLDWLAASQKVMMGSVQHLSRLATHRRWASEGQQEEMEWRADCAPYGKGLRNEKNHIAVTPFA